MAHDPPRSLATRIKIDGAPATVEQLQMRALSNYGHFTSMQVRGRAVRGLGLHLDRLNTASGELFGIELDRQRVLDYVSDALGDGLDATVRVDVHRPDGSTDLSVMVTVRAPAAMASAPQRLVCVAFERPMAHLKHVGTFGQIYHGLRAERSGFDDALLITPGEVVIETTVANVGLCLDGAVVWPDAPGLAGITLQLLNARLPVHGIRTEHRRVRREDLFAAEAVLVLNSTGVTSVGQVDHQMLDADSEAVAAVTAAYAAVPFEPIVSA